MSRIGLVFLLISLTGRCFSQDYFVLIQADNKQPFYVRLGDKSVSSSAEGSIILGQLRDTTYNITVGFPGQSSSDQLFRVEMHHRDQQFLLRNQEDKGWILYNPLTGETRTTEPKAETGAELRPQGTKKDDAFSRLMAGVVHDTAVMYNTYAADQSFHDSTATAGTPGQKQAGPPGHPLDSTSSTASAERSAISGQPSAVMVPGTNPASGVASPAKSPVTGQPSPSPVDSSVTSLNTPATTVPVTNQAGAGLSASTGNASAAHIDTLAAIRALRDSLRRMVDGTDTRTQVQTNASAPDFRLVAFLDPRRIAPESRRVTPESRHVARDLHLHRIALESGHLGKLDSTPVADSSVMAAPPPPVKRAIVKLSERKLTRSLRLVFADKAAGQKTDTIVMLIPLDTLANGKTHNPTGPGAIVAGAKTGHPTDTLNRTIQRSAEPANDPASLLKTIPSTPPAASGTAAASATPAGSGGNSVPPSATGTGKSVTSSTSPTGETVKAKPDTTTKSTPIKSALPFINSDCHAFATDYDVDRLRVKLLQSSKDEDRIQVARKIFKTKCFSTRQIKALSEVFATDAQKYKFYETAYPFASDDQFRELGSTLTDPVYSSKFRAMTGQ